MDVVAKQVQINARRVIGLQLIIAAVAAVVITLMQDWQIGMAALYGGAVSAASSLLLRRGILKASEIAESDPKKSMVTLYVGAVQRFVLVLALFGLGLGLLKLDALASVIGFGCSQLAYALIMRRSARPGQR